MRRMLIFGLVCLLAGIAAAQEPAFTELFQQNKYPATVKLRELDATWQKVRVQMATSWASALVKMSSGHEKAATVDVYFTRGQMTTLLGMPYLVLYRIEQTGTREQPGPPLTPDAPVTLSLASVRDIVAVQYLEAFDLERTLVAFRPPDPPPPRPQPEPRDGGPQGAETTLKVSLQMMRNAIEQFQADTGAYPAALTDLVVPQDKAPARGVDAEGKPVDIKAGAYLGPYLAPVGGIAGAPGIPVNPLVNQRAADPDPKLVETHWKYANGALTVPDAMAGLRTTDGATFGEL